jgi:Protein of unknown function (DUF1186)/SEC-C motif
VKKAKRLGVSCKIASICNNVAVNKREVKRLVNNEIAMLIENILRHFEDPNGRFPEKSLDSAIAQQEAITPHLLSILEKTISNFESVDDDKMDHIFALYLLSKFREKRAFPYIVELASLPGKWPENLLGDCITEALARFIVSTFNDDLGAIKKLIEDSSLNEWSRKAGLNSLLGLVALDQLGRDELIEYLRSLFRSPLADDDDFVTALVEIASEIYPEELMEEINEAFREDKVDTFCINRAWVERMFTLGKEKCLARYVYDDHFHLPIDDIEQAMLWMNAFRKEQPNRLKANQAPQFDRWDLADDESFEVPMPYVRATPKIGRNDLCYCGSGKKFKKCCLN